MDVSQPQFLGAPCGSYGHCTFHKAFKFTKNGKQKIISLGDFFFVRISKKDDPCIGELQLLWLDRNSNQHLSSVRLYFLPEQTPEGRLSSHGEDEVLAASDKVVLRLDDLVDWITDQVDWTHGLLATCSDDVAVPPDPPFPPSPPPSSPLAADENEAVVEGGSDEESADREKKAEEEPLPITPESPSKNDKTCEFSDQNKDPLIVNVNDKVAPDNISGGLTDEENKQINRDKEILQDAFDKEELRVIVMSYPNYCRYRSVIKRLEGVVENWLRHALVVAIGGFTSAGRNTHILFCRDTFDHEELAQHDLNCEYLAPILKARKQRKKGKNFRSASPGSESNTSDENKEISPKGEVGSQQNGFKQPPCKTEQEFLQKLFKFMKKRNTPIQRVPHLGFKQIDLFVFFSFAQKLGGYDKITGKKLWKHVYDELGGSPGSTSAATCTRRHYERLLLPFERYMDGRVYKPKQSRKVQNLQVTKMLKDENSNETTENSESKINGSTEVENAYAFTDSNHENSKDSNMNDDGNSLGEELPLSNDAYSDDDSKTIWSIQRKSDGNDEESKEETKQIKPLIIQKEQNESFSEKERKWNEIRKKNALARKWVRQLRPSRGSKSTVLEKSLPLPSDQGTACKLESSVEILQSVKSELSASSKVHANHPSDQTVTSVANNTYPVQETQDHSNVSTKDSSTSRYLQEKCATVNHGAVNFTQSYLADRVSFPVKPQVSPFPLDKNSKFLSQPIKTEPLYVDKPWCGYARESSQSHKTLHDTSVPYSSHINTSHCYPKQEIKPVSHENSFSQNLIHQNIGQLSSDSSAFSSTVKSEIPDVEDKPKISQRRPSVIQHTESITSPSPSQSPKHIGSETFSDVITNCGVQALPSFSASTKNNTFSHQYPNHLLHNIVGKVSEWLTKGVPEAVACKTPSIAAEKTVELHDKVLMPSSCKTPGPGTGKVPMYMNKSKTDAYYSSSPKTVREKLSMAHRHRVVDTNKSSATVPVSDTRSNLAHQKTYPPVSSTLNPNMTNVRSTSKCEPMLSVSERSRQYCEPLYNQPKRHKSNTVPLPATIPPRPSMLPFVRQQMYRTSPLSDIPRTTALSCNDYENTVLDLSVKKRPHQSSESTKPSTSSTNICDVPSQDDGICLDLTVKKKPAVSNDNGIENITPPLPSSPNPSFHTSHSSSTASKSFSTLLALQEIARDDIKKQTVTFGSRSPSVTVGYNAQPTLPVSPLVMPASSAVYSGTTHAKFPPDFINSLSDPLYAKEMAKSLYMSPDGHTAFPQYVIPSFYSGWTSVTAASSSVSQASNSETSPNSLKGVTNHGVFPKHYMYNYKQQFHPVLCKDNGHYPSKTK